MGGKKKNVLQNLVEKGNDLEDEKKTEESKRVEAVKTVVTESIDNVTLVGEGSLLDGLELSKRLLNTLRSATKSKSKDGKMLLRTQVTLLTRHSDKLNQLVAVIGVNKTDIIDNLIDDFLDKEKEAIKKILLKSLEM